jgi:hypothetical protein
MFRFWRKEKPSNPYCLIDQRVGEKIRKEKEAKKERRRHLEQLQCDIIELLEKGIEKEANESTCGGTAYISKQHYGGHGNFYCSGDVRPVKTVEEKTLKKSILALLKNKAKKSHKK